MDDDLSLLLLVAVERLQQPVQDLPVLLHRQVVDGRLRQVRRNVAQKRSDALGNVVDLKRRTNGMVTNLR